MGGCANTRANLQGSLRSRTKVVQTTPNDIFFQYFSTLISIFFLQPSKRLAEAIIWFEFKKRMRLSGMKGTDSFGRINKEEDRENREICIAKMIATPVMTIGPLI